MAYSDIDTETWYWNSFGVGDAILAISAFAKLDIPILIKTSVRSNAIIGKLIEIFGLSKLQTMIVDYPELIQGEHSGKSGWNLIHRYRDDKSFRYFTPDSININGNVYAVNKKTVKPFIGLFMHNGAQPFQNLVTMQPNSYPACKYYSAEFWQKVQTFVLSADYDIMIINSWNVSVEQKIYLLNEFCSAVIGYEGGLCHVAHALRIPTFILPWTTNLFYADNRVYQDASCFHLDKKTWLLSSAQELLDYSTNEFNKKISDLQQDKGNIPFI